MSRSKQSSYLIKSAVALLVMLFLAACGTGVSPDTTLEVTASVDLSKTSYNYDFGTPSSPVQGGWTRVAPNTRGDIFWTGSALDSRDRGVIGGVNAINRDFVFSRGASTFNHKIANGVWTVTLNMGDPSFDNANMTVRAEGEMINNDIDPKAKQFVYVSRQAASTTPQTFDVTVRDGQLNIEFSDRDASNKVSIVNRLSLRKKSDLPSGGGQQVVANGSYRIRAEVGGNCVRSAGYGAANRTNAVLWDCDNLAAERKWTFEHVGGNVYKITNVATTKVLEVGFAAQDNNANVATFDWANVNQQKWKLLPLSNNRFQLQALHSNKCLAVDRGGTANGTNLVQYTCDTRPNNNENFFIESLDLGGQQLNLKGSWSSVQDWPLIATHLANTPDGRMLAFSSYEEIYANLAGKPNTTEAVLFDPATGGFQEVDNPNHDMFCAGLAIDANGRLITVGGGKLGGGELRQVSRFTGSGWSNLPATLNPHWYGTAVYMPNNEVIISKGNGSQNRTEVLRNGKWNNLPGVNYSSGSYPDLFVSPRGTVFVSGPNATMYDLSVSGNGVTTNKGTRAGDNNSRNESSTVMMENSRILMTGGYVSGIGATDRALTIDISGANPKVTQIAKLNYSRAYHTTILLPNGEAMVAGGRASGAPLFNDDNSRLIAEIYNPKSNRWRAVAAMETPRNYHSTGLLLPDARVLMAGGGLCRDNFNCAEQQHPNAEIFSPPYLFKADGTAALRPSISTAPNAVGYNQGFNVKVSGDRAANITTFSMIKLSSVTHTVNTDLRREIVSFRNNGSGNYRLTSNANRNVLTPGYYYLFAVNDQGVPSVAKIIQVR